MERTLKARKPIALVLITVLLVSCVRGKAREPQVNGSNFRGSSAREVEIGRQIHQQITSAFQMYTEPRLVGYVTRVGRSLTKAAERKDLPYLFTVLYDDRVYATEAPGGFVYVTTGYLNFIQNEAELAAALAHEIGQLQIRDSLKAGPRRALNLLAQGGAVAAPFFGQFGVLIAGALVLMNAMTESTLPSPDERLEKADQKALRYLLEAGHDPQGYLDLLNRLVNGDAYWSPYLFDYSLSRPITTRRYQAAVKEFHKLPLVDKTFSVHRERYLDMTKGVREIYQR